MLQKNAYEPKDARILSYYEDDEIDDELADLGLLDPPRSGAATRKKKMTGTQALAEFLSTTSPEEFQKSQQGLASRPTEPSSTNFFKLRKSNKRRLAPLQSSKNMIDLLHPSDMSSTSSSFSAPGAINRKNYIEIIPKMAPTTSKHQQQNQQQQQLGDYQHVSSPVLPSYHKKRDSSVYSGSLRHSTSIRSQLSGAMLGGGGRMAGLGRQDTATALSALASGYANNNGMLPTQQQVDGSTSGLNEQQQRNVTHSVLSVIGNMDVIEAGLVQRLERCRIAGYEKPSDSVAHSLVNEHMRALDISFQQEHYVSQHQPYAIKPKPKVRHVQVQTMDMVHDDDSDIGTACSLVSIEEKEAQSLDSVSTQPTLDQLEKQLIEEKKHRQRLQASLNETRDHFEILSGLAYKKLREIWEEKLRWENTCIKLNEQLLLNQQQQPHHYHDHNHQHQHQPYDDIDELASVIDKHNISLSVVS